MNKQQYVATKARLEALKVQLEDVRDNMIAAMDDGTCVSHEFGNAVNSVHDAISDTKKALDELESDYSRRNWTSADYAAYSLVAANID
jgi:hypothetical protein